MVRLGGSWRGNRKSWKTLRVERLGWNLVGRISTSPRYMVDITRLDLLSFEELERGGGLIQKNEIFLIYKWMIGSLWNFNILKDFMSERSYFKSWPNLVTLGGVRGGNQKSWKTLRVERLGWNLVGRTSTSLRYVTWHNQTRSALFGGVWEGGGWDFQCFGKFGASGHAMMMKNSRCVRDLHKLTW